MGKLVRTSANLALTLLNDGDVILVDATGGAVTITLPSAVEISSVTIRKTDTSNNAVTVQRKSPFDTVDGGTSMTISKSNNTATLVSDGQTKFLSKGTDKYTIDYRQVTADAVLTAADYIVGVSGSSNRIVVTLPSASLVPAGREYRIHGQATAASALIVSGSGQTIDGADAVTLSQVTGSIMVYCNGTNWRTWTSDKL